MSKFLTPILLIVFNRPQKVRVLIDRLRILKPAYLYVTADGPRNGNYFDIENCKQVREEIDKIDWDCQLYTNYSSHNKGCRLGVSTGIDWFFSNVNHGIILEDDIIPNFSFFRYCEELLIKYENSSLIGMISGCNPVADKFDSNGFSYSFSTYANIWGWATWKRSWSNNDLQLLDWTGWRENRSNFNKLSKVRFFRTYWKDILDAVHDGKVDTWDFQWFFTLWKNSQLCIVPSSNLIQNIGFDEGATHTDGKTPIYLLANEPKELDGVLNHPEVIQPSNTLDDRISRVVFKIGVRTIFINKLRRVRYIGDLLVKLRRFYQKNL
jgi:hypothetical protein